MACCGGGQDETTKEIDRIIKKEARAFREQVKLLLLGASSRLRWPGIERFATGTICNSQPTFVLIRLFYQALARVANQLSSNK